MVAARILTGVTTNWTATLPRKRMDSSLLFRDSADRFLLVEPA